MYTQISLSFIIQITDMLYSFHLYLVYSLERHRMYVGWFSEQARKMLMTAPLGMPSVKGQCQMPYFPCQVDYFTPSSRSAQWTASSISSQTRFAGNSSELPFPSKIPVLTKMLVQPYAFAPAMSDEGLSPTAKTRCNFVSSGSSESRIFSAYWYVALCGFPNDVDWSSLPVWRL